MRSDFRENLPTFTESDALFERDSDIQYSILIDGRDIFISEDKKSVFLWNGYGWSKLRPEIPNDAIFLEAYHYSLENNILKSGWNIITGPDIRSHRTGLVNPYDFKRNVIIPFDTFKVTLSDDRYEKIIQWANTHYVAGVIFSSPPRLSIIFSGNFGPKADIRTGKRRK